MMFATRLICLEIPEIEMVQMVWQSAWSKVKALRLKDRDDSMIRDVSSMNQLPVYMQRIARFGRLSMF